MTSLAVARPTAPAPGAGAPIAGSLLRAWRERRHLSQLGLSAATGVSTRHLSCVETGRSRPTAEMVLRLCEALAVPLRERNAILLAAGHAPAHPDSPLHSERLRPCLEAVRALLDAHAPFPALLVDAEWTLVDANRAVAVLVEAAAPALLEPPVNVLRLSLHPDGLAPHIGNLPEWRSHLLHRLARQAQATASPVLAQLLAELRAYPGGEAEPPAGSVVVPLRMRARGRELSLLSATSVFGTPLDVTLAELAVESFFPADGPTAAALRELTG
ncbi:transcriptional regulator with XRE-family HTH domain [Kineococcus xinjiangensis]|uniref:Transcriptional regulator with XRE-family HTH domain n=1 Tax=Kineococcus xinjiangensis TaxID=512762 RepID=A0A2S6IPL3_9ACTN|nr:helix-turn-helix transcriptional regulator [Kineococcus xinjiangensis]PPK96111.1 transcriptional regulator with XRE-family HTH domain [Kineococcus xinjiangensis]